MSSPLPQLPRNTSAARPSIAFLVASWHGLAWLLILRSGLLLFNTLSSYIPMMLFCRCDMAPRTGYLVAYSYIQYVHMYMYLCTRCVVVAQ